MCLQSAIEWFRDRPSRPGPGRGECTRCGVPLEADDDASLHEGWCYTCDADWFESQVIGPLVKRLGKEGAVRAFRRLVRDVRELV